MHLYLCRHPILVYAFHVHRSKDRYLVVHIHYLTAVRNIDVVIVYVPRYHAGILWSYLVGYLRPLGSCHIDVLYRYMEHLV